MRRPQFIMLLGSALLVYVVLSVAAEAAVESAAATRRAPAAWAARLLPGRHLARAARRISARPAAAPAAHLAALLQSPASPQRWADHADALLQAGRPAAARDCYLRAVELGPLIAPVLLRAATFHLANGDRSRGLALSKTLLANLRDYDSRLFELFDRFGVSSEEVVALALPDHPPAAQAYFAHLLETHDLPALAPTWQWMSENRYVKAEQLGAYATLLLEYGRPFVARRTVRGFLDAEGIEEAPDDRVFNGGFERDPIASPFEWQHRGLPCVTQQIDHDVAFEGEASWRLDFDCPADEPFQHLVQRVVLPAGPARLSLRVRLDKLDTAQGIGVWLVDASAARRLSVQTAVLSDTRDWTPLEVNFSAPAGASDLELRVFRRPSIDRGGYLRASVWLDKVSIQTTAAER